MLAACAPRREAADAAHAGASWGAVWVDFLSSPPGDPPAAIPPRERSVLAVCVPRHVAAAPRAGEAINGAMRPDFLLAESPPRAVGH